MNLTNLKIKNINRIVAHTIHPKTSTVDAYASYMSKLLEFEAAEKLILISRLEEALINSKKTFQLEFEDKSDDSIYKILHEEQIIEDSDFYTNSKLLADDLAEAHFRVKLPGGFCLIGEGESVDNEYFFFVIKAELQEVFSIEGTNLKLIKDVFLSPAKDFYKIGFFIKTGSNYIPFMYDDQFSMQKKDLTEYFYGKFLGLTTDRNDTLKSKNFFQDTKSFIETNVPNSKDRIGLLKALTVEYREEASGVLSPKGFSEKYFEGSLKAKFDKIVETKYPLSFTKKLELIDKGLELQRLSIPLSYSLFISGSSDSLEGIEIIDDPTEAKMEEIEPEINSGVIKKIVLLRERKSDTA